VQLRRYISEGCGIFRVRWSQVLLILLMGLFSLDMQAADNDFEGHFSAEMNKSFARNWEITLSEELRFNRNMTNYSRSETGAALNYTFARKYVKASVGYAFINKEKKYSYYDNRHRIYAQFVLREQFGHVKLSWRSKLQSTFENEATGEYKRNPKIYWRNRLTAAYKLRNSKCSPYVSFEFFLSLNDAQRNRVDALRSAVGCDYILTRRSSIGAYLRMDNDIQVKNRQNTFSLGLSYVYDF